VLPIAPLGKHDGWCDEPDDPRYNQQVRLPYGGSHEELWRADHIYDLIVVLGFNDDPVVPGYGSAVFFHVARPAYNPTEGCVAVALTDLLAILEGVAPGAALTVPEG
jgi:L,D-peptidoglycan transpeptidase YkuD (ErfK/YbiS/YcfS/YnhG family)